MRKWECLGRAIFFLITVLALLATSRANLPEESINEYWNQYSQSLLAEGNRLLDQGNYIEAIDAYNGSISFNGRNKIAWINRGYALSKLDKWNEAIYCFDKVIEIDSKSKEAWYSKGFALITQQRFEEAIKCFDRAIEIDPTFIEPLYAKGSILAMQGKYGEAVKYFNEIIE